MDCDGHGTHVAGIIGANNAICPGVAPKATLAAYRVFGCTGVVSDDVLIAAFTRAHDSGGEDFDDFPRV